MSTPALKPRPSARSTTTCTAGSSPGPPTTPASAHHPDHAQRVVDVAVELFGRVDVVVNSAGGSPAADAATASPRFFDSIVRLNLLAPLYLAQRANAVMQKQAEGGAIVNIGSVSGTRPSPGSAAYGAAKAGLINLTQTLAMEWAPKVRVNCVTPRLMHTEDAAAHYGDEAAQGRVAATVPAGRMGDPREVADACLFLASNPPAYTSR